MEIDEQALSRIEQLLEDNLEVAEENNKLLHSLRRTQRWAFWGKLLLWIIVLGLPVLLLGPYLHALLPVTGEGSHSLFGLPSADQVKALLNAYHASGTAPSAGQ